MADMLYMRSRGRVLGPFDEEKLKSLARRGQLNRMHELSDDGVSWQRASSYPHLFEMGSFPNAGPAPGSVAPAPQPAGVPQPMPVPNAEMWYYAINNVEQASPVSFAQLQSLAATGQLSPADMVWKDGMENWTPVSQVPDLIAPNAGAFGPAQPVMPQPVTGSVAAPVQAPSPMPESQRPAQRESGAAIPLSVLSIIFALVSLLLCPPLFGFVGLICGIIGTVLSTNKALGIIGIVLSIICSVIGMVIGAAIALSVAPLVVHLVV